MDMLARYLQALRSYLPRKDQDDIVRELSDNLLSQMEDREEALGRPLSEEEQADILRRHGHPMIVASRYRRGQHLIGPVFFPMYVFALKVGLGIAALVTVVLAVVTAALRGDPGHHAIEALGAYSGRALMVFAWTTLGFAAFEMAQSRVRMHPACEWDPRKLPKVVTQDARSARLRALGELVVVLAALVWLLLVPRAPFLLLGPAAALVDPASIWRLAYVPLVLVTIATAGVHALGVVRPLWTRTRAIAQVALHAASFVVFVVLLRGQEYFVTKPAVTATAELRVEGLVHILNVSFQIGFFFAAALSLVEIGRAVYRARVSSVAAPPPDSAATARH